MLGRYVNPKTCLLNELEKVWIMRQLYSGSVNWDKASITDARKGLAKLWESKMGKEDYADFVKSLPIF